jgi:hypothetical protein
VGYTHSVSDEPRAIPLEDTMTATTIPAPLTGAQYLAMRDASWKYGIAHGDTMSAVFGAPEYGCWIAYEVQASAFDPAMTECQADRGGEADYRLVDDADLMALLRDPASATVATDQVLVDWLTSDNRDDETWLRVLAG